MGRGEIPPDYEMVTTQIFIDIHYQIDMGSVNSSCLYAVLINKVCSMDKIKFFFINIYSFLLMKYYLHKLKPLNKFMVSLIDNPNNQYRLLRNFCKQNSSKTSKYEIRLGSYYLYSLSFKNERLILKINKSMFTVYCLEKDLIDSLLDVEFHVLRNMILEKHFKSLRKKIKYNPFYDEF